MGKASLHIYFSYIKRITIVLCSAEQMRDVEHPKHVFHKTKMYCRLSELRKILLFHFEVQPGITHISEDITVNKGDLVTLKCAAGGYPAPNITWTRLSDNSVVTFPLTITGNQDEGGYRCTADNGFGIPASRDVFMTLPSKCILLTIL